MSRFFYNIEKLRTFACIMVIICHMHFCLFVAYIPKCLFEVHGVVQLFFTISGFVYTYSIKNYLPQNGTFLERLKISQQFLKQLCFKRFFRICPVMFFIFILTGIFYLFSSNDFSWFFIWRKAPFQILTGIFNEICQNTPERTSVFALGLGHFWTIAIEFPFYLLWPILLLIFKNNGSRAIFSLLLGLFTLFIFQYIVIVFCGYRYYSTYNNVATMFLGAFFAFIYEHLLLFVKKIKLFIHHKTFFEVFQIFLLVLAFWVIPKTSDLTKFWTHCVIQLLSVVIVVISVLNNENETWGDRILVYIGRRSYSLYAIHILVIKVNVLFANILQIFYENSKFLNLLIFMLTLWGSTELTYNYIEKPFRKLRNTWF